MTISARSVFTGIFSVFVLAVAAVVFFQPHPSCGSDRKACPPVIGVEKGYTLWLTAQQPQPGMIYNIVSNDGVYGVANPISSYIAQRVNASPPAQAYDESVTLNDTRGVKAAGKLLSKYVPTASAKLIQARSMSFETKGTWFQRIPSHSEFVTWIQAMDLKTKENDDGRNLFHILNSRLLPADQPDPPGGSSYIITEVRTATTVKFEQHADVRTRVGLDCDDANGNCEEFGVGRDVHDRSGRRIAGAQSPLVFLVQLKRIGSANNGSIRYDEGHEGPLIIGL